MRLIQKLYGVVDRMRGGGIPRQEWVDVDGATDTARLLRAIAGVMPRGALLNVLRPRGEAIEAFVRRHAVAGSRPEAGDFLIPITGMLIGELAALAEQHPGTPPCSALFVVADGRHVVEAYRRDAGEDVVWLAADLPGPVLASLRAAVVTGEGPPSGAARDAGHATRDSAFGTGRSAVASPGPSRGGPPPMKTIAAEW